MKTFAGGMNKDTELLAQPEGTYRDALNINLNYTQGSVINEEGVSKMTSMENFIICGTAVLDDDRIVMFGRQRSDALEVDTNDDGVADAFGYANVIRLFYPKEDFAITLYQSPALNFQPSHRVVTTHRKNQAGETLVYFTDGFFETGTTGIPSDPEYITTHNPPRVINIDKQLVRVRDFGDQNVFLYGNAKYTVDKLRLTPFVGVHATFVQPGEFTKGVTIQEGGALECGAYYLALAYIDEDGLETNYFTMSNPVYIASGPESAIPTTSITGGAGGTFTNKSITFEINVPSDAIYTRIQPAVVKQIDTTTSALKLSPVPISSGQMKITVTGLEDSEGISVEDILVDDVDYITAQTISQQNNRLYLGNLKTNKDIGYQGYANNIGLDTVTETVSQFNPRVFDTVVLNQGYSNMLQAWGANVGQTYKKFHYDTSNNTFQIGLKTNAFINETASGTYLINSYSQLLEQWMGNPGTNDTKRGYKNVKYNYGKKGYRRSEVYAFYISFILNDGTETYAYHIPGREAQKLGFSIDENFRFNQGTADPRDHRTAYGFHPGEFKEYNDSTRICEIADTTDHTLNNNGDGTPFAVTTGYWENDNEVYPNTPDFNIAREVDEDGSPQIKANATGLQGKKVRHHKMPSNFSKTVPGYVTTNTINDNAITEHAVVQPGENTDTKTKSSEDYPLVQSEQVNILGIKLKNIQIPKYILDQVQGYKVYYAKRSERDKTVLGQSLAIPAHPRYASVPDQNVVQAKKGPYYRGWYLYGGLVGDWRSSLDISPKWRDLDLDHRYYGNPAFTFHDFTMLRKKVDVTTTTHVSVQYGIVFRHYLGGPGNFVNPCRSNRLRAAPADDGQWVSGNSVSRAEQESTTLPSAGWVDSELANTTSFTSLEGFQSTADVVDISDSVDAAVYSLPVDDTDSRQGRIKRRKKDDDAVQGPADGEFREAKKKKVRAFFTGVFVGTAYVDPYACLQSRHVIKGSDVKYGQGPANTSLNKDWRDAAEFDAVSSTTCGNLLHLVVAPKSITYVGSNSITKIDNATSFSGATYIYNKGGESSILVGMVSGLPTLRGHIKEAFRFDEDKFHYYGLTRWDEPWQYLFPDAADESHERNGATLAYQRLGQNVFDSSYDTTGNAHKPSDHRGLSFSLTRKREDFGFPMAWLVNLCSAKTDVFQPFDSQKLVWTGVYHKIDKDAADEVASYYDGAVSPSIFGGDTFICKYGFRTTSQSYGHTHFRLNSRDRGLATLASDSETNNPLQLTNESAVSNDYFFEDNSGASRRTQGDIPLNLDKSSPAYGTTSSQLIWQVSAANSPDGAPDNGPDLRGLVNLGALTENDNWVQGTADPVGSVFSFMVESEDNLELRHTQSGNDATRYFDYTTASDVLFAPPTNDFTASENMLYAEHYSALQDKKVAVPIPLNSRLKDVDTFKIRVARSNVDSGSLSDGYRKFKALEYKDIDANRGEIKNIFSLSGTLYIHTRRAMYLTKGKEELQLSAVTAFIGSGNIFTQDPDELAQAHTGKGGTDSRHAHVTTEFGHFYVNRADRCVYNLMGNQIQKISDAGMSTWFRDNTEFSLKTFGIDLDGDEYEVQNFYSDSTTAEYPIGFTLGYDPKYKRVLITKREPIPTSKFVEDYNEGRIRIINNIPTLVPGPDGDACDEFLVTQAGGNEGSENFGSRGQAPKLPAQSSGTPYCGPIALGNPLYFTQGGWTVSYYPEKKVWGSRHSYLPDLYVSTSSDMFSVSEGQTGEDESSNAKLWKHGNERVPGGFYGTTYNAELEFVDNTGASEPKLFYSIYYWADSYKRNTRSLEIDRKTSTGFTSFYAYNSTQISGTGETLNYLSNARLVNKMWNINNFRDMSKAEVITSGELIHTNENIAGNFTTAISTNQQTVTMFTEEGVVNADYIDSGKSWFNKGKFMDHYLAVRLINDNSNGNLVHLHGAGTNFRKSHR